MKITSKIIIMVTLAVIVLAAGLALFLFASRSRIIKVTSFYNSPIEDKAFKSLILEFRKQNPGYDVSYKLVKQNELEQKIGGILKASDTPDIITWFSGNELSAFASGNLIEPLDTIVGKEALQRNFSEGFRKASSRGDNLYLLPLTWNWWTFYYSKDIFKKNKLDPPQTWEAFIRICETLKAKKITPIAFAGKDEEVSAAWFALLDSASNGWEFHKELISGTIPYTDAKIKAALRLFSDLNSKGYFQRNFSGYDLRDASMLFLNNEAGICLAPARMMRELMPVEKTNSFGYFRFPDFKGQHSFAILAGIEGFMVPKKSFNKTGAAKFLRFMSSADSQDLFLRPLKSVPANINAPVPDAETRWALTTAIGASYLFPDFEKDVPEKMAEIGLKVFTNLINNPAELDSAVAELKAARNESYTEARQAPATKTK